MLRNVILLAVAILIGGGAMSSLAGGDKGGDKGGGAKKQAPYMHAVIFYLKKDAPKGTDQALIEDSHKLLAKIPSVRQLWVGRPAKDATPKVAVTDYAVGLTIAFDDYAGLKTYIDHDLHTQYVDKHGKHIEKVLVYDFNNEMK
jgi:hypothetical protein